MNNPKHILTNGAMVCALAILIGNTHAQQFPIPTTASEASSPPPGTAMTTAYVQTVGRMYVIAFTDSDGTPLVGASNYRVNLPANIRAKLFWSVTLYEAENASGLANGQAFPSLGSRDKPAQNADGSTDPLSRAQSSGREARQLVSDGSR